MTGKNYVWYASYGSNLSRDRFLCYIQGGQPEGSADRQTGCNDSTPPLKDQAIMIPYPLYFSKHSERWNGAPAFIGHQKCDRQPTIGRMYLITEQQFADVVRQENDQCAMSLDLAAVRMKGAQSFDDSRWYGRVVHLGERGKHPIFTFTAPWDMHEIHPAVPSSHYLITIIRGIKELQKYKDEEILRYLSTKPGIKGFISDEECRSLIQSV